MAVAFLALTAGAGARPLAGGAQPPHRASIYWGAYMEGEQTLGASYHDAPWDDATWRAFEQAAGKRVSIVHWGVPPPWQAQFNAQLSMHRKILRSGALELLDVSSDGVPLSDIAAGKYDGPFTQWAQQARAFGHPLFLRWDWEMNGRWFPWATMPGQKETPQSFVQSWRHIHDIFKRVGATNVSWVWCPNVAFNGSTPYSAVYPGAAYVDWTCLDGYNKGGDLSIPFTKLFGASYHALLRLAPNKPIMIGETASAEDSGKKPAWIAAALAALPKQFSRIKALVWFNWQITENGTTWSWPIESSSAATAAFAHGISAPYFRAGGHIRLPKRMTAIEPPR